MALIDPVLTIAVGPAAFAALGFGTTAGDYTKYMGEVVTVQLSPNRGYAVYVAPDVHSLAMNATETMWAEAFEFKPTQTPVREPVRAMRWHIYRALSLAAYVLGVDTKSSLCTSSLALDKFYDNLENTADAIDVIAETAKRWTDHERFGSGSRWDLMHMALEDTTTLPGDEDDEDDEGNGEEVGDDTDSDTETTQEEDEHENEDD